MKDTRVEFRSSPQEKDLLALAAQLSGVNVSAFLRDAAIQAANKIIREHEEIRLSNADRALFLKALENPSPPSSRLRKAMKKYKNSKSE